ncbi:MAG: hypothetical protein GTN76_11665 [Candidatus Aenigmarchaeota archaeon]|nr:hypothetical protein [Candidatus Aenigmarchaeota archaeon]NIQ18086.1 hypothetical protein [Candidatus Aenigmarchaeota archaeon]
MLESLLRFKEVEKSPYLTFVWALMITTIGILFSTQLSYRIQVPGGGVANLTGLFAVIFTIVPSVYFLTTVIKKEEEKEEEACRKHYQQSFWDKHGNDILMFLFYFFGVTFAFAIWALVLPTDFFQVQLAKIEEIRSAVTGAAIQKGSFSGFMTIFTNNLQVMMFAFIFSLLFGAGAVFIIVWNASVLGVFIGKLSKTILHIPAESLRFLPHGIPEVLAYLCAGLAGGLISAAILRCRSTDILKVIVWDSVKILLLGILLLVVAAGIEVYI